MYTHSFWHGDEDPTEGQVAQFREVHEKLGYAKGSTEVRLMMPKSKGRWVRP